MNSTDILKNAFRNEREVFLNTLSSYTIVDIGTIDSVDAKGRAHVTSSAFINNRPVVYEDAEVIFPGNANGSYATMCSGCTCLIFIPRSCMPDSNNQKIRFGATPYNRDGVKAMPIGSGVDNTVKPCINSDGSLTITTDNYSIQLAGDSIEYQKNDGSTSVSIDGQGQLYVLRQTDNGTYMRNIEDDSVKEIWQNSDKSVQWTETLLPDGSRDLLEEDMNNLVEEGGDPLLRITISKTGEIQFEGAVDTNFTVKGDVNLDVDGDVSVNATNIKLNGDSKRLVTYAELKAAMDKLWIAMTTTPIAGEGSPQPSWTGLDPVRGIDISASETQTIKTGG